MKGKQLDSRYMSNIFKAMSAIFTNPVFRKLQIRNLYVATTPPSKPLREIR